MSGGAQRGFTLIEVVVALAIVALGMSALLEALSVSAGNIAALRDKTVAEWIALNKIADARLTLDTLKLGVTEGQIGDCARGEWHWRQEITAVPAIPGLLSISVSVRRTGNATPRTSSAPRRASGTLAAPTTLGAIGPLGSVGGIGAVGCVATAEPGDVRDHAPTLGATPRLGGPESLGAAAHSPAEPSALGMLGSSGSLGRDLLSRGSSDEEDDRAAHSSGSRGDDDRERSSGDRASDTENWLVTLTGFRGNSLGAANGENPSWDTQTVLPGNTAARGSSNGTGLGIGRNDGVNGNGTPQNASPTVPPNAPGSGPPPLRSTPGLP